MKYVIAPSHASWRWSLYGPSGEQLATGEAVTRAVAAACVIHRLTQNLPLLHAWEWSRAA